MGALKVWDGSQWQTVSQSGPEGTVWVGTDAPATADDGDLWYDTDDTTSLFTLPVSVADGGTGGTSAVTARTSLGLVAGGQSPTVAGAPTAGTWARGDTWLDVNNLLWVCTTGGTPGSWKSIGQGEELAYNEIAADVTITNTSSSSPTLVIEGTSRSYDGQPVIIEFYCPGVITTTSQCLIAVRDGSTDIGYLINVNFGAFAGVLGVPVYARRRITPTAGIHNYRAVAWVAMGSTALRAGVGNGPSVQVPAFIRVTRA